MALASLLGLLPVACATAGQPEESAIQVVATTSILGDIASRVIGDRAEVEVIMPLGVDSHEFQPSANEAGLIAGADLVVANGLDLEVGLLDVLEAAETEGTPVIELGPLVDPLPFAEHHAHDEEGGEGAREEGDSEEAEHGPLDPHFWMDPLRAGTAALALAGELTEIFPEEDWAGPAMDFVADLEATDQAITDVLAGIPASERKMVTNHEAFGYFADRYDFEILGVVIPGGTTLAAPSSAELARLVETMEHEGATVIFAETSQPTALAESVAAELGDDVEVVELYTESLGPPGSGAESLTEMLFTNARRIAEALG
jgi:zinc/manganese transport system substrate-binding protein